MSEEPKANKWDALAALLGIVTMAFALMAISNVAWFLAAFACAVPTWWAGKKGNLR